MVAIGNKRPDTDSDGKQIRDSDLITISSNGNTVYVIVDDSVEYQARPAKPEDCSNKKWLSRLDWSTATLIESRGGDPEEEIDEGGIEWGG